MGGSEGRVKRSRNTGSFIASHPHVLPGNGLVECRCAQHRSSSPRMFPQLYDRSRRMDMEIVRNSLAVKLVELVS
jgi:hypothetical protein